MAWHWVQAIGTVMRMRDGNREVYRPGDWLQVQSRDLLRYQAEGKIRTPAEILKGTFDFMNAGVLRVGATPPPVLPLGDYGLKQDASEYPALPWRYTLLTARAVVSVQNAALGFLRVEERTGYDAWELAAQLQNDYPMAEERGTPEERALTLATLGDLRLPLYDTTLLWVRRTEATLDLIGAWTEELRSGADRDQSFLRALYTRRVLVATLPPAWVGASLVPEMRR